MDNLLLALYLAAAYWVICLLVLCLCKKILP
jgi:hypothetical protein